jgi:hypothetical protein
MIEFINKLTHRSQVFILLAVSIIAMGLIVSAYIDNIANIDRYNECINNSNNIIQKCNNLLATCGKPLINLNSSINFSFGVND